MKIWNMICKSVSLTERTIHARDYMIAGYQNLNWAFNCRSFGSTKLTADKYIFNSQLLSHIEYSWKMRKFEIDHAFKRFKISTHFSLCDPVRPKSLSADKLSWIHGSFNEQPGNSLMFSTNHANFSESANPNVMFLSTVNLIIFSVHFTSWWLI